MADLIDRGELRKDFCNMCEAMQPEMIDCNKKGCMSMQIIDEQQKIEAKPKTNGDRIRQMTDEELADVMQGQCACCAYQLTGCTEKECNDGAYKWLKHEVSENAGTD